MAVGCRAPLFTVFGMRIANANVKLVGDYSGIILNCDRAKMYLDGRRLWCWAKSATSKSSIAPAMAKSNVCFASAKAALASLQMPNGPRFKPMQVRYAKKSLFTAAREVQRECQIGFCDELYDRRDRLSRDHRGHRAVRSTRRNERCARQ